MIFKKIIALCKKSKAINLYDTEDGQWLSNGYAIYKLYELPHFDENSIYSTFDITDKQQEKIRFNHFEGFPENLCFDYYAKDEILCERYTISFNYGGTNIIPIQTSKGVAFIDNSHLAPVSDIDSSLINLYERVDLKGNIYFAIKAGFNIYGIITPIHIITDFFVSELNTLAKGCESVLKIDKENDIPNNDITDTDGQETFNINEKE